MHISSGLTQKLEYLKWHLRSVNSEASSAELYQNASYYPLGNLE